MDSVIFGIIDCMKREIPLPNSDADSTLEPTSALRGLSGGHARCIDWDEVCILDPTMSRKILTAYEDGNYADV